MRADMPLMGLGYVGVADPDPKAWLHFGTEVCGMMPARIVPGPRESGVAAPDPGALGESADGTVYLKMDDRQWRIAVHRSDEAGLRYLGFELPSHADLARAARSLDDMGIEVVRGARELCEARGVAALAALQDPAGHRIELYCAPLRDRDFESPHGASFLTGPLGMGHAVLYVPDVELALDFYTGALGFRRTDYMVFGPDASIHFLRCTERHHSLALLHVGHLTGLQHLMLEMESLDDVGRALDRALASEIPITSNLGRHINDRTVSFYMRGPSGFDVEIGWDGVLVGDDWVEHEFAGTGDEWGHHGLSAETLTPGSD